MSILKAILTRTQTSCNFGVGAYWNYTGVLRIGKSWGNEVHRCVFRLSRKVILISPSTQVFLTNGNV